MNTEEYRKVFLKAINSVENIAALLQPKLPILGELQLTSRQESIMILFIRHEGMTLGEMSERLGISKSAVTQAINKLEKEDLLIRSINENNRREVTMSLGGTGKKLKEQFEVFEASIIEDYFTQLNLEDLKHGLEVVQQLEGIIKKGEMDGNE
ncbi:MarR family transcriptional regulator [Salibacterium aidingense]|uniref:MarR family transcriptional regulator n=1 Tax=Salibacterium aidingense TaxID=384933 RepID=UPI000428EB45|nr:MarR family transcriptional regulator [Salibacterium aidingense]